MSFRYNTKARYIHNAMYLSQLRHGKGRLFCRLISPCVQRAIYFPARSTRSTWSVNDQLKNKENTKHRLDRFVSLATSYRWVPWCSGYHVCLTRRRSRVRASLEPNNIFAAHSHYFSVSFENWQFDSLMANPQDLLQTRRCGAVFLKPFWLLRMTK